MIERVATGADYLELITALLQRARLAADEAGLWEAGDLQWWWRRDQHADPANARFWIDDEGVPIAAVIVTDFTDSWGFDVIAVPDQGELTRSVLWPNALERIAQLPTRPTEIAVRDDDLFTGTLLRESGFAVVDPSAMTCWMAAADHPDVPSIATGYRLVSTADRGAHPHHMVARNGAHVAERLRECSLYRPELDLCIEAPSGEVAAYGLFWADPVTRVGLVEPMRTEDQHQNKGLGRHLLCAGLARLAQHGCTRLKVTYLEGNEPAGRLYVGVGFTPRTRSETYRRTLDP